MLIPIKEIDPDNKVVAESFLPPSSVRRFELLADADTPSFWLELAADGDGVERILLVWVDQVELARTRRNAARRIEKLESWLHELENDRHASNADRARVRRSLNLLRLNAEKWGESDGARALCESRAHEILARYRRHARLALGVDLETGDAGEGGEQ